MIADKIHTEVPQFLREGAENEACIAPLNLSGAESYPVEMTLSM